MSKTESIEKSVANLVDGWDLDSCIQCVTQDMEYYYEKASSDEVQDFIDEMEAEDIEEAIYQAVEVMDMGDMLTTCIDILETYYLHKASQEEINQLLTEHLDVA